MTDINEEVKSLIYDLDREMETMEDTAASAARARKLSSRLSKLFVSFRRQSVAYHKKK